MREQSGSLEHLKQIARARRRRSLLVNLSALTLLVCLSGLCAYAWLMSPAGEAYYSAQWYRQHNQLLVIDNVYQGPWDFGSALDRDLPYANRDTAADRSARPLDSLRTGSAAQKDSQNVIPVDVVNSKYMPLDEVASFYIHREEHNDEMAALQKQIAALKKQLAQCGKTGKSGKATRKTQG